MKKFYVELTAGLFVLVGIACLVYVSIKLGTTGGLTRQGYPVTATFSNIGGLRTGAAVVIAGVTVGRVEDVKLKDYAARIELKVDSEVKLPTDCIAAVKTRGLIGEKYVSISPGASEKYIKAGERIRETQAAVDLESLISKYAFGEVE